MSTLIKRTVRGTELGERGLHEEESGDKKLSREMSSPLQKKEAAGKTDIARRRDIGYKTKTGISKGAERKVVWIGLGWRIVQLSLNVLRAGSE